MSDMDVVRMKRRAKAKNKWEDLRIRMLQEINDIVGEMICSSSDMLVNEKDMPRWYQEMQHAAKILYRGKEG